MQCDVCLGLDHEREGCPYTPYIRTLQSMLENVCLPIWFSNEAGRRVHGSMTVVDTGEAVLGITAGHVADRILECCDDRSGRRCQIGSAFLPLDSFIARHTDLDLATFRLSQSLVSEAGRQPAVVPAWPPGPPVFGELVMLGGYPGIYRRANVAQGIFESDFSSFGARISDVDERSFSVEIPLANSFSVSEKLMPPNVDLAGASGGGVFRLVETFAQNQLTARLELIGIIYYGSPGYEVIRAHPIDSITVSGDYLSKKPNLSNQ
jgi:hypothetical protein